MRFGTKIVVFFVVTICLVFFSLYSYNYCKEFLDDNKQDIFYFEKIVDVRGSSEGFPGVNISFSCNGWVETKLYTPDGEVVDHNYFVTKKLDEEFFKLGGYRENVEKGSYKFKIFDSNSDVVSSKNLFFNGSNLSVLSCEKLCWKYQQKDYLIGLKMMVENRGYLPVYPDDIVLQSGSNNLRGDVVPCVIQPGEKKCIYGLFCCENENSVVTYNASLFGSSDELIASTSISAGKRLEIDDRSFDGNSFYESFSVPYPDFLYSYFKSLDIPDNDDYGLYIFDPYDDRYIEFFTDVLTSSFKVDFDSLSDVDRVNYIASFVQSLSYQKDPGEIDDPRYPFETLFDEKGGIGDCEDKSILAATLLEETGFNVSLLKLIGDDEPGHMAVGVNLTADALPDKDFFRDGYYYLETTSNGLAGSNINSKKFGFALGVVPQNLSEGYETHVFEISQRPLLNHYWKKGSVTGFTNTSKGDFYKVNVVVENLGSKTAENVVVKAAVYSRNEFLDQNISLEETEDEIDSLKPYGKKEITLLLNIEKDKGDFFTTEIYVDSMLEDVCKAKIKK
ncbi:MAG: hypothetical protein V5A64_02750 [Candidatus Thermoplasmatota archaeon]